MNEISVNSTWTDEDWAKFHEWLNNMLHIGPLVVTFTKKDGTERVMNCTLEPSKIPSSINSTAKSKERKKSKNSIAVYDLDKNGWRSFTINSVKKIEINVTDNDS